MSEPKSKIEIIKRKCTSFFEPNDRILIQKAVKTVHTILSEATHLLKANYIEQFESSYGGEKELKGVDDTKAAIIDSILLHNACLVVQGHTKPALRKLKDPPPPKNDETPKEKTKREGNEKQKLDERIRKESTFASLLTTFNAVKGMVPIDVPSMSLSHIIAYSIDQTMTAYKNNVWMHYPKYVKKWLYCCLLYTSPSPRD